MHRHGYLELKWVNDTLYVTVFGPFNTEGAHEAAQQYITEIKKRNNRPFSVIEYLDNDSLGSPEVMKNVYKIWCLLGESGCKSLALVYANTVQRSLAEKYLPNFGNAFSDLASAEQWISNRNS
ncbi:hypothetical protein [Thalassotalea sp. PLHSN55]|uniref:hypothetical protein n=1 Tax=Thalassotalea sp. PLHSN55 TaxID=3435888 RepID=UPI003F877687